MRRFAGRDCERATFLLDLLDRMESIAASYLRVFEALERQGHADTDSDEFNVVERVERLAVMDYRVREAAMEAGLVANGDVETDPLPLIRMFLPITVPDEDAQRPAGNTLFERMSNLVRGANA